MQKFQNFIVGFIFFIYIIFGLSLYSDISGVPSGTIIAKVVVETILLIPICVIYAIINFIKRKISQKKEQE